MENKKLKTDVGPANRGYVKNRVSFRLGWSMGLVCLIMLILISPTTADSSAEAAVQKSTNREIQLEQQLWKDNISPPAKSHSNRKTEELKQIIEQVRSVQFESASASQAEPQPEDRIEPQQQTTPEDKKQKAEPQSSSDATVDPAANKDKSMHNQMLNKVETLFKDPNAITTPFELAEVLFQTGELALAGVCYKKALSSLNTDDPNVTTERAWILFQIGNCLKDSDPNASKNSYAELIRTAPDSPWARIAKSRHSMIDWYQQEQPRKLIEELNR